MSWLEDMAVRPTGRRFMQDPEPYEPVISVEEQTMKLATFDTEYRLEGRIATRFVVRNECEVSYAADKARASLVRFIHRDAHERMGAMYHTLTRMQRAASPVDGEMMQAIKGLEGQLNNLGALLTGDRRGY